MADLLKLDSDSRYAVYAEAEGHAKALIMTDLTFERLVDEVVVPYESDQPFFLESADQPGDGESFVADDFWDWAGENEQ